MQGLIGVNIANAPMVSTQIFWSRWKRLYSAGQPYFYLILLNKTTWVAKNTQIIST